jgi:hypothetical protein
VRSLLEAVVGKAGAGKHESIRITAPLVSSARLEKLARKLA